MEDYYRLSVKLNEYFRENIKLSLVSRFSAIIVTNEYKVYEFERKGFKSIAINISKDEKKIESIIEDSIVEELCHKQIVDIKSGVSHTIARTSDGKVYC